MNGNNNSFRIKIVGEDLDKQNKTEAEDFTKTSDPEQINQQIEPQETAIPGKKPLGLARKSEPQTSSSSPPLKLKQPSSTFPQRQYKQTKPNQTTFGSSLLFTLIFFGSIGTAIWFFFIRTPAVYGPAKVYKYDKTTYELVSATVLEHRGDVNGISFVTWLEMEAHYKDEKIIFKSKKGGEVYKGLALLVFKKPSNVKMRNILIDYNQKDLEILQELFGKPIEQVAKDFFRGLMTSDQSLILSNCVPVENMNLLWANHSEKNTEMKKQILNDIDNITFEKCKPGDKILFPKGVEFIAEAKHVTNGKAILIPVFKNNEKQPMPFIMVNFFGEWKVEPTWMIRAIITSQKPRE